MTISKKIPDLRMRISPRWLSLLLPVAAAGLLRGLNGLALSGTALVTLMLFSAGVLLTARASAWMRLPDGRLAPRRATLIWGIAWLGASLAAALSGNTLLAWLSLGGWYALSLGLLHAWRAGQPRGLQALLELSALGLAGAIPALTGQLVTHFSSEEFFVALEALFLAGFWLSLRLAYAWLPAGHPARQAVVGGGLRPAWLSLGLLGLLGAGLLLSVAHYQRSFYPQEAPGFAGISAENPFLCGQLPVQAEEYAGAETFARLLERVAANPNPGAPEYGLLALGHGDLHWAQAFRTALLDEAGRALFTGPAGSVKYGQYLAGQRAYFYPRVLAAFPGLFNATEQAQIQAWFAAINRSAWTIEWVDWSYALAFTEWPSGPYENQENGAGLLSLLELHQLGAAELSQDNRAYLLAYQRGWLERFRVTDDAAVYQPEWIENAWFQSLYSGQIHAEHLRLSFEWIKLLAPPDGSRLGYNHPGATRIADIAWLGAVLTGDPEYVWLAGRALDYLEREGRFLDGQPGAEQALALNGTAPQAGSCLLYGDSGLPTQAGPLAPDKIVLRGGWQPDDLYLLLNLRFSGWHRYKATNTIQLVYQGRPLLVENSEEGAAAWLPSGRSLFRDKRIPREYLNGLVIAKSGFSAVLFGLTGFGGPWAQDPPYYASVTQFDPAPGLTTSRTEMRDWHGWDHQRVIYFDPTGLIVVLDQAQAAQQIAGSLLWHFPSEARVNANRISLPGETPVEVVLLPAAAVQVQLQRLGQGEILQAAYAAQPGSPLLSGTVFLSGAWHGAQVSWQAGSLQVEHANASFAIDLETAFTGQ